MKIFTDAHQFLIDLGYDYTYFPADVDDPGDGENGPSFNFYPAYGVYADSDTTIYVEVNGSVTYDAEPDRREPPEFFD